MRLRCALFAVLVLPLVAAAQEADPLVLVQRIIDTRYGQSEQANADFDSLLQSPVERVHVVKAGDTLQHITSRLFGIGPKSTPTEYAKLEQKFRLANSRIVDVNRLKVGTALRFPDLPPKQYKEPDKDNPNYQFPRISPGPRLADVKSGAAFSSDLKAFTAIPTIADVMRKASPIVIQWRWMPASLAKREIEASSGGVRSVAASGPMQIRFADEGTKPSVSVLPNDAAFIKALLARRKPGTETIVFILDDSWPTQTEFVEARNIIRKAVDTVRMSFHLGKPEWDTGILQDNAQTDFPYVASGRGGHARDIAAAIQPFSTLTGSVKVVYLPVFVEQKWAREIWREIILVSQLAKNKADNLDSPNDPIKDAVQIARTTTDELLSQLPSMVQKGVANTDQILVAALLKLAQLNALATKSPYFVSMSWTVLKNSMELVPDPDALGLPIAAAGNDLNSDIIANKTLFAYRAKAFPGDVLAVMNANVDGSLTCSSHWNVTKGEVFYGLAYDGALQGGGCGTSFSTPRVAWLLALREAYKGPLDTEKASSWFSNYRAFLLGLQDDGRPGYLKYWLAPQRLFSGL